MTAPNVAMQFENSGVGHRVTVGCDGAQEQPWHAGIIDSTNSFVELEASENGERQFALYQGNSFDEALAKMQADVDAGRITQEAVTLAQNAYADFSADYHKRQDAKRQGESHHVRFGETDARFDVVLAAA